MRPLRRWCAATMAMVLACATAGGCVEIVIVNDGTSGADTDEFTATAEPVEAPDYTVDVAGILLETDASNIVQSATGSATLDAGSVAGQRYVVADAAGLDTQAAIDAAYLAGNDATLTPTIAAAEFMLEGDDLTTPQQRTLIIANISSGVRAYQVLEVTFHEAP